MAKRIAFEMRGTLTVAGKAPQKVDVIVDVPSKPDRLLAFIERHRDARIVGYSDGEAV